MASAEGVEESLDFDFFETPRDQNENAHPTSPAAKPPRHPESSPEADRRPKTRSSNDIKGQETSSKPSPVAKKPPARVKSSDSYSSDSSVSDTDDTRSREKNKKEASPAKDTKHKSRRSPSHSSLSSSGSDSSATRSLSRRSRSRSRSRSWSGSDRGSFKKSRSGSSVSSDSDGGRPSNPIAKDQHQRGTAEMPKRGRSRLGEDEYSSSAYSEGEDDNVGRRSSSNGKADDKHKDSVKRDKTTTQKQAWGDRPMSSNNGSSRPKSAKTRTTPAAAGSHSEGSSSRRKGRGRGSKPRSDTETLSDSDITDVSPMDSPRHAGAANNNSRAKGRGGRGGDTADVSASGDGSGGKKHRFMAMPVNGLDLGEDDGGHDVDDESDLDPHRRRHGGQTAGGLDLEILMKAVGELEKQKRVQANSRRVMFAPMGTGTREKGNYTFDQGKTRDIERENQRLLNEIVRRVNSGAEQKKQFYAMPASTAYKLTPSAINRERDMKRIESENMAFLKRLQKVKPTSAICRDHQLRSYESTTLHGVPIAALHPLPGKGSNKGAGGAGRRRSGASSVADTASSIGSRTRSMTSIHSAVSSVRSSKRGSRPSSATVRPGSATKRLDTRPEWSDRW